MRSSANTGRAHDVEGVGADRRLGGAPGHHAEVDRPEVGRDGHDPRAALGPEPVEEALERQPAIAVADPDHPPRVVAHHHGEVAVRLGPADLIDPDAHQPVEAVAAGARLAHHAGGDATDARPGDAQVARDHRGGGALGQPGTGVLEGPREARPRAGEGHRLGAHPAAGTAQARQPAAQLDAGAAQIEMAIARQAMVVDLAHHLAAAAAARGVATREGHLDLQRVGIPFHPDHAHPLAEPEQAIE
jgi:hypothetical protein